MRRFIGISGLLALAVLAGCAAGSSTAADASYERYWRCAYDTAMAERDNRHRSPRAVANHAQRQCEPLYSEYRRQRIQASRAAVDASSHALSDQLADQAARERRRLVSQRLTELVRNTR